VKKHNLKRIDVTDRTARMRMPCTMNELMKFPNWDGVICRRVRALEINGSNCPRRLMAQRESFFWPRKKRVSRVISAGRGLISTGKLFVYIRTR
jgi:hypothetical protein